MDNCPICDEEIDVSEQFSNAGGDPDGFQVECPHCGETLDCTVEWDPVFTLKKAK